ncbi:hypothetical protein M3689_20645 [Alkalihalophilus marmarensis]|jgi:amino acid transporter|uniref:hypothetical protein n=1 Tax=Alkalihalophilus marmarensis TaxID=521377 RepID=UPI00203DCFEF|nr:hypothetical protein [Alkalihalophilus marmarensis]MCM3491690.1 hypothetical protein [Alkalihalophilus marmarensis]
MAKWSTFQILVIANVILFMFMLERMVSSRTIQPPTAGEPAVNSSLSTLIVYIAILIGVYLLFLFEAKKNRDIFRHKAWLKMPQVSFLIAIASTILFLVMATIGPLFAWVEQFRFLLYLLGSLFLFMTYLFIFSLIHKSRFDEKRVEGAVHWSLIWTTVLFAGTFYLFPSL